MAQHFPAEKIDHKAIVKICDSIKKQKYFRTSMKFQEMPSEYAESLDDQVFITHRNVPASIVAGGKASFEVHTKPAKIGREVTKIYLVA